MTDYLKTKKKKPLKDFVNHPIVNKFNVLFTKYRAERLLYRMGFNQIQRENVLKHKSEVFENFDKVFSSLERVKVSGDEVKVADGVNHPPLFNMRTILGTLPHFLLRSKEEFRDAKMPHPQFYETMLSTFAQSPELNLDSRHETAIARFQMLYKELIILAAGKSSPSQILRGIAKRAESLNSEKRITGNALIEIVEMILVEKKRGLSNDQIQKVVDRFIHDHLNLPEAPVGRYHKELKKAPSVRADLYSRLLTLVVDHRDDI